MAFPPEVADSVQIVLQSQTVNKNRETAVQKEKEHHNKAFEALNSELESRQRTYQEPNYQELQQRLDQQYIVQCREYMRKKKEQVKQLKTQNI